MLSMSSAARGAPRGTLGTRPKRRFGSVRGGLSGYPPLPQRTRRDLAEVGWPASHLAEAVREAGWARSVTAVDLRA
jgi:hypothetical protein